MKFFRMPAALIFVTCLVGCSPQGPFVQSDVVKNRAVHVITDSDNSSVRGVKIYIMSIDGAPTRFGLGVRPEEAFISMGPHVFDLQYFHFGAEARAQLRLNAIMGHDYVVHYDDSEKDKVRMWFTDGWDGPVVGGVVD